MNPLTRLTLSRIFPCIFVLGAGIMLGSCAGVAAIAGTGAQVAGALGVIDQGTADAITRSGEAIGKATEEITPEQEYYIGRAVAANILTTYKAYSGNQGLLNYLNRICGALVINSPKPDIYNGYHVMILENAEINAFASSGGHIFITRGLLNCADSEDALAAVIAHEIAHIQLQHSIKAIKTSRITQAIMVTGTSAAGIAAQNTDLAELTDIFDESVNEIISTLINNGYSREQEFEADALALSLMASAGYQPSSLIDMLRALEQNQPKSSGGFNKTHPAPAQRISNVEKNVNKYPVQDTRSFRRQRFTLSR
ncbi:MAG: M48 family metalloprotease [Treponema sp.]|jgi:predicted Zn-dependent protease|nr:M48 family metalloprotease [Treponema sp.]